MPQTPQTRLVLEHSRPPPAHLPYLRLPAPCPPRHTPRAPDRAGAARCARRTSTRCPPGCSAPDDHACSIVATPASANTATSPYQTVTVPSPPAPPATPRRSPVRPARPPASDPPSTPCSACRTARARFPRPHRHRHRPCSPKWRVPMEYYALLYTLGMATSPPRSETAAPHRNRVTGRPTADIRRRFVAASSADRSFATPRDAPWTGTTGITGAAGGAADSGSYWGASGAYGAAGGAAVPGYGAPNGGAYHGGGGGGDMNNGHRLLPRTRCGHGAHRTGGAGVPAGDGDQRQRASGAAAVPDLRRGRLPAVHYEGDTAVGVCGAHRHPSAGVAVRLHPARHGTHQRTAVPAARRRPDLSGAGADAGTRGADSGRGHPLRRLVAYPQHGGVRRSGPRAASAPAEPRCGDPHRHPGSPHRLSGERRDQLASRHLFGAGRGGPDAGHGLRAAAAQDRRADPARTPDADVHRHLAARSAGHRARLYARRPGGAYHHRQSECDRQQEHQAGGGGGERIRQADAPAPAVGGAAGGGRCQGAGVCGHQTQGGRDITPAATGRRGGAGGARGQVAAGTGLGDERVSHRSGATADRHRRGGARVGYQGGA
eukprot:ctg_899.g357